MFFLITRSLFDPAIMPNRYALTQTTLVDKLRQQNGIKVEETKKKVVQNKAPAQLGGIPSALRHFFSDCAIEESQSEKLEWLLTMRFAKEDYRDVFSKLRVSSSQSVEIYPFLLCPNAYVVSGFSGSSSIVLVMNREFGMWKIDNVIVPVYYDSFLDMNVINWDCKPHFDYE